MCAHMTGATQHPQIGFVECALGGILHTDDVMNGEIRAGFLAFAAFPTSLDNQLSLESSPISRAQVGPGTGVATAPVSTERADHTIGIADVRAETLFISGRPEQRAATVADALWSLPSFKTRRPSHRSFACIATAPSRFGRPELDGDPARSARTRNLAALPCGVSLASGINTEALAGATDLPTIGCIERGRADRTNFQHASLYSIIADAGLVQDCVMAAAITAFAALPPVKMTGVLW